MFKSIFWKQFVMYMGTLLIMLTVLAAAASQAFKGYFISQREELLTKHSANIAGIIAEMLGTRQTIFSTMNLQSRMDDQLKSIQDYMETSVLFIDEQFEIFAATTDVSQHIGAALSSKDLQPVMEGYVVTVQGMLDDIFPTSMLSVAYPIVIGDQVRGAVILNSSIPELEKTTSDVMSITLVCVCAAGAIAFVLIYLSSRSITKPLQAMNEAAKVIAGGDFDKRIQVTTQDEVGQLGESFNNMAESLHRQEAMRRDFISNISHDIRSPLTSMRGFLQAIVDGTVPPEKTGHYLNIVMEETQRLSKLANDLLDLNKAQSLQIELARENFDINDLIRKTVVMLETRVVAGEINLNLSFAEDTNLVNGDYEKIQRVVYNLLDNALKFTLPGGRIDIVTDIAPNKILVTIADNGCGIDEEQQKMIFDRFYKADESRGQDKTGSGLGLAIVKAFVKAHDESISLESAPDKGSKFTFSLQRVKADS